MSAPTKAHKSQSPTTVIPRVCACVCVCVKERVCVYLVFTILIGSPFTTKASATLPGVPCVRLLRLLSGRKAFCSTVGYFKPSLLGCLHVSADRSKHTVT